MREIELKNYVWIDIEKPTQEDIDYLSSRFHFHHLALEDAMSVSQRPKIDVYDDHIFSVFHLPRYIKAAARTVAMEIDVFLSKNYLVTVHEEEIKPLNDLFTETEKRSPEIITDSPAYLLYELLDKMYDSCFPMLDRVGAKLDRLEDRLYYNHSRQVLEEISLIELDIINFRRIINPQRYAIKDLESVKSKHIGENLEVYFDDIDDKLERVWDLLDGYKEVSEILQRTNETIINHRLNEIIKILTIFSVIMLPLTVITGFYGMNIVGLPFASHTIAAEIITGILVFVIVVMLLFFYKKRWL